MNVENRSPAQMNDKQRKKLEKAYKQVDQAFSNLSSASLIDGVSISPHIEEAIEEALIVRKRIANTLHGYAFIVPEPVTLRSKRYLD